MKIVTVIGARPQFVKAAAVSRVLRAKAGVEEKIIHTGQHFDANMSDVFFEEMEIPLPDYHLEINSLSHGAMTGRMLEQIESVLKSEKPEALMVYGDTNSTLAGALAAKKRGIKVVHVEAGLRSFNMAMPEEVNRILTDRISDVLFCPTDTAIQNLEREGFRHFDCDIVLSGDVMQDAALFYAQKAAQKSGILKETNLIGQDFLLCTFHRQENTDNLSNLQGIVQALNILHQQMSVVVPLHPRTRKIIEQQGLRLDATVLPPVGYFDMIQLLQSARLVLTDSGGLQKEAYFFDKYCVTLRDQTEWSELVEHGYNQLTGADTQVILDAVAALLKRNFVKENDFYGGGRAAENIASYLSNLS